jgi:hypothetical protein
MVNIILIIFYLLRVKPFRLINPSGFGGMDGFSLIRMCGKD